MNGLSSGALQKTTSFVQPQLSASFVRSAVSRITDPRRRTASMLMPALEEPTFTEAQTLSVTESASVIERMSSSSEGVIALSTSAENPPRKFTPVSSAALSSVLAIFT